MTQIETVQGKFFEDFLLQQEFHHTPPFMITSGDVALYDTIFGSKFPVTASNQFAMTVGYARAPIEDMIIFQCVSVRIEADFAPVRAGEFHYRNICFFRPTYLDYTLTAITQVVSLEDQADQENGLVRLQTEVINHYNKPVLAYDHVMPVRKRDIQKQNKTQSSKDYLKGQSFKSHSSTHLLAAGCPEINTKDWHTSLSGCRRRWRDYKTDEIIDHIEPFDLNEMDHRLAMKLFRAPINHTQKLEFERQSISSRFLLSVIRAASHHGLRNAFHISRINGFQPILPCFAGEMVYLWSEIIEKKWPEKRNDVGLLRVKTFAKKNAPVTQTKFDPGAVPQKDSHMQEKDLVFVCDYWVVVPI